MPDTLVCLFFAGRPFVTRASLADPALVLIETHIHSLCQHIVALTGAREWTHFPLAQRPQWIPPFVGRAQWNAHTFKNFRRASVHGVAATMATTSSALVLHRAPESLLKSAAALVPGCLSDLCPISCHAPKTQRKRGKKPDFMQD